MHSRISQEIIKQSKTPEFTSSLLNYIFEIDFNIPNVNINFNTVIDNITKFGKEDMKQFTKLVEPHAFGRTLEKSLQTAGNYNFKYENMQKAKHVIDIIDDVSSNSQFLKAVSESMNCTYKSDIYQKIDNIAEDPDIKKSIKSLAALKSKQILDIFKAVGVDVEPYGLLSMYNKKNTISEALKKLTPDQLNKLDNVYAKLMKRKQSSFSEKVKSMFR